MENEFLLHPHVFTILSSKLHMQRHENAVEWGHDE